MLVNVARKPRDAFEERHGMVAHLATIGSVSILSQAIRSQISDTILYLRLHGSRASLVCILGELRNDKLINKDSEEI